MRRKRIASFVRLCGYGLVDDSFGGDGKNGKKEIETGRRKSVEILIKQSQKVMPKT